MIVSIYIGGLKLDMFNEETIELNSSIADIKDITKNQTDFTKTFTVPASSNNNIIFNHWYDADLNGSFDARIKIDGDIRLDGVVFKIGKFRLHKVAMKKEKPYAYTINFWGNLLDIKDKLGKDLLSDLDLTAFNHDYDSANIKTGLQSSLFSGDVIYNLLAKKQYYYSSDITDTTVTDELVNIGYGDGSGSNGVDFTDLRPSLRVIKLIEAIETKYDITFSRDFFGLKEFNEIYTWLNPSKDTKAGGDIQVIDWDGGDSTYINHTTNIGSFEVSNTSASNDNYYWKLYTTITPSVGYEDVPYTLKFYKDDSEFNNWTETGTQTFYERLSKIGAPENPFTWNVYWEVETDQEFKYTASVAQYHYRSDIFINLYTTTASENTIDSVFSIADNIPKVKIIDFLKGLFNMFKLVVIPQGDGTIYIDTFKNYYLKGITYEITKYIDFEKHEVERGKILNEINFLFSEPSTILNKQFEENNNIAYGDSETILKNADGDVLDGDTLEFTLPFETILFERLNDIYTNTTSNIQYGAIIDSDLSPVNPKMTLFYNVNQNLGVNQIGFIDDTNTKTLLSGYINTPSHSKGFFEPNFSLLFNSEYSTWDGLLLENSLYKNYHEKYLLDIFNVKKRGFKYSAKLPLGIAINLQLNDVLQIRDTFYRINSFTTNLTNGDITLDLVNSFDDIVGSVNVFPKDFYSDSPSRVFSSSVTNSEDLAIEILDVGDGVGWVSVEIIDGNVFYTITENTGSKDRFSQIKLTSKKAQSEDIIYITQEQP